MTGSYGKTSVKFYLQTLLQEKYNVLVTPESFNTPMGVVRTIRGSLKPTTEILSARWEPVMWATSRRSAIWCILSTV